MPACAVCRQPGHNIKTCLSRKEKRIDNLDSPLKKLQAQIEAEQKEYDEWKIKSEAIIRKREQQKKRSDIARKDDGKDSDESSDWTCVSTSERECS